MSGADSMNSTDGTSTAPSFSVPGWRSSRYPLGGIRTGPAWRAMWRHLETLADGQFATTGELVEVGATAGECATNTARLILIRAANSGILRREYDARGGRRYAKYRIAEKYYRRVWDLLGGTEKRSFTAMPGESADHLAQFVRDGVLEMRVFGDERRYRVAIPDRRSS